MTKILMTRRLPEAPFKELENDFEIVWPQTSAFSDEEVKDHLKDSDVVVSVFGNPLKSEAMKSASRLKLIANFGAGVDNIDVDLATSKGIVVTNTPDPVTEPTAELAMGLMVDVSRRIAELDRGLRERSIPSWGVMDNLSTTLQGKTLGIIGMGAIGQALARRALAFGMKIIYHNRKQLDPGIEDKYEAKFTDLESLLRNSDFVSLNVPLTVDTRGLIGRSELNSMKPSAFLVNTARGPVVDQGALIRALRNKEIAGAALDVYENEPNVPAELLEMSNVVLTPHVGTATRETREVMSHQVAGIIRDFYQGMRGLPVVNPDVWNHSE
ncbi:MAG: NAD(P)-dependent oxidoreductase [Marinilabiliaceae bacterium]